MTHHITLYCRSSSKSKSIWYRKLNTIENVLVITETGLKVSRGSKFINYCIFLKIFYSIPSLDLVFFWCFLPLLSFWTEASIKYNEGSCLTRSWSYPKILKMYLLDFSELYNLLSLLVLRSITYFVQLYSFDISTSYRTDE